MTIPAYELFAVRYATRDARRSANFLGGDPHDAPMPMDYHLWAARSPERCIVIDTGFTRSRTRRRTSFRATIPSSWRDIPPRARTCAGSRCGWT